MNILRKAMAEEAERLKPLLGRTYSAIKRFQEERTPANEARLRAEMAPAIIQLMIFKPLMPLYKQEYFTVLESEWERLGPGDLIMLFDHCVSIMHLRLERMVSRNEAEQPWSHELLEVFNQRRMAPTAAPAGGDFLCAGAAASPGRAVGFARVVVEPEGLAALRPGEILVCRFSTPDWMPYLQRVQAIVTDQGGALSHAAIVARELAIPSVTGCQNATETIRTGDRIEVNGDLGIVTTA
ncbi:MAG: PEP-utilizing enzyme [Bacillota bacterium]